MGVTEAVDTINRLASENDALRARIASLEAQLTSCREGRSFDPFSAMAAVLSAYGAAVAAIAEAKVDKRDKEDLAYRKLAIDVQAGELLSVIVRAHGGGAPGLYQEELVEAAVVAEVGTKAAKEERSRVGSKYRNRARRYADALARFDLVEIRKNGTKVIYVPTEFGLSTFAAVTRRALQGDVQ